MKKIAETFAEDPITRLCGIKTTDGKLIIPCIYKDIEMMQEGNYLVQSPETHLWGMLGADGREILPCRYENALDRINGFVPIQDPETHLWGLLDPSGIEYLPCVYDNVSNLANEAYNLNKGGQNMYEQKVAEIKRAVEEAGYNLLDVKFKQTLDWIEEYEARAWQVAESKTEKIVKCVTWAYTDHLFEGKYAHLPLPPTMVREEAKLIAKKHFETNDRVKESLLKDHEISKNPDNEKYSEIVDHYINQDYESMYIIKKNGFYGIMDSYGQVNHECEIEEITEFNPCGNMIVVNGKTHLWGIINDSGNIIAPYSYKEILQHRLVAGYIVQDPETGLWGTLDSWGDTILPCEYGGISEETMVLGCYVVQDPETQLWGLVNSSNENIEPLTHKNIKDINSRLILEKDKLLSQDKDLDR